MEKFISLALETIKGVSDRLSGRIDGHASRLDALEKRELVKGPQGERGPAGENGKDADGSKLQDLWNEIYELQKHINARAKIDRVEDVEKSIADLRAVATIDIDELVKAILPKLPQPKSEDGKEGRGVTPDEMKEYVAAHVGERLSKLPAPRDGKSVTAADVAPLVVDEVHKAIKALPTPENGKDGKPGDAGKDGASVTAADLAPMVAAEVEKAVKALPVPKNGENGKDGRGVKSALIDNDGGLVVTFSDGEVQKPGKVVGATGQKGADGQKGQDGKDGADGMGFDDYALEFDGERTFKLALVLGDRRKDFGPFKVPGEIYRGVFVDGKAYERGDCVTWAGSEWHANEATTAKPGLSTPESRAWTLKVKRGADGKPGLTGKDGLPGPKGDKGDRGYGG